MENSLNKTIYNTYIILDNMKMKTELQTFENNNYNNNNIII